MKLAGERVHFTGEKLYHQFKKSEQKLVKTKNVAVNTIKSQITKSQEKFKTALQSRITTTKEFTDAVKERFSDSWLHRRFLRAFPNLQVKSKVLRLNEKNEKK